MTFVKGVMYLSAYAAVLTICDATLTQPSIETDANVSFQEINTVPCNTDMDSMYDIRSRIQCASVCVSRRSCFLYFKTASKTCLCNYGVYSSSGTCNADGVVLGQMDYMHRVKKLNGLAPIQYSQDCLEIYEQGHKQDGIYVIQPTGGVAVDTWCDMTNGGWTVIQRRQDGSENFLRNWTDYVDGFGNKCGEYWLGLDSINLLTTEPTELYIYMETFGDALPTSAYARYSSFSVGNSSTNYKLSVGGYSGDCGDSFTIQNGMQFTTIDVDNDIKPTANCAIQFKGAWWHTDCHASNLNGLYLHGSHSTFAVGVNWRHCWGYHYSLKKAEMKIRRL